MYSSSNVLYALKIYLQNRQYRIKRWSTFLPVLQRIRWLPGVPTAHFGGHWLTQDDTQCTQTKPHQRRILHCFPNQCWNISFQKVPFQGLKKIPTCHISDGSKLFLPQKQFWGRNCHLALQLRKCDGYLVNNSSVCTDTAFLSSHARSQVII